jgi:hypothetical protein
MRWGTKCRSNWADIFFPIWKEHCTTYRPMSRDRQAGNPTINIQSALRTAPYLCKNVSLQCYLVVTVIHTTVTHRRRGITQKKLYYNSYTVFTQSDMCVYTQPVQSGDAGWGKERKSWDSSELRVPFWPRVPEVRHHPCPRGTDIASRLLRKPNNSYMLLILSEKM